MFGGQCYRIKSCSQGALADILSPWQVDAMPDILRHPEQVSILGVFLGLPCSIRPFGLVYKLQTLLYSTVQFKVTVKISQTHKKVHVVFPPYFDVSIKTYSFAIWKELNWPTKTNTTEYINMWYICVKLLIALLAGN